MTNFPIPNLIHAARNQHIAQGLLAISDIADQLSHLYAALRNRKPDSVLTACVRRMSVSLRSLLVEKDGRLFTRLFQDGSFPVWPTLPAEILAKEVVDSSPGIELEYELTHSGERRRLRTPPYRHEFVIRALHGITKCEDSKFAVLSSGEVWTRAQTVHLVQWLKQPIFQVDGLVYDLMTAIKLVADKEGAHIDPAVDSEGIYTGNSTHRPKPHSNHEAYVRARLIKFGPFTYPHVIVLCVARFVVTIAQTSLRQNASAVESLANEVGITQATRSAIRERIEIIQACPNIGRLIGLPLQVSPERLVMRPPISLGVESSDEEQRHADVLPRYGETYIGASSV